jgi:hypothetical protein
VRSQTAHGTEVTIDLGGSDPDGDAVTLSRVGPASHGAVVAVSGLTVRYTPDAGFAGTDRFGYELTDAHGARSEGTVDVEVAPDQPPTALRPLSVTTAAGTAVVVDPKQAAEDADGGPVLVLAVTAPRFGSVGTADGGALQYLAPPGFWGSDRFTYEVAGPDGTTLTGTVAVEVPLDATAPRVLVSTSPDRSGPVPLAGGALGGPVAIFVEPASEIRSVRFFLDDPLRFGPPRQTEVDNPFDLGGTIEATDTARLFDPSTLALGDHDLTIAVSYLDGREALVNLVISWAPPAADIASA